MISNEIEERKTEEERKKTTDEEPHTGKSRAYTSSVARTSGRGTDEDPRTDEELLSGRSADNNPYAKQIGNLVHRVDKYWRNPGSTGYHAKGGPLTKVY